MSSLGPIIDAPENGSIESHLPTNRLNQRTGFFHVPDGINVSKSTTEAGGTSVLASLRPTNGTVFSALNHWNERRIFSIAGLDLFSVVSVSFISTWKPYPLGSFDKSNSAGVRLICLEKPGM
jgi:hypothetical protein